MEYQSQLESIRAQALAGGWEESEFNESFDRHVRQAARCLRSATPGARCFNAELWMLIEVVSGIKSVSFFHPDDPMYDQLLAVLAENKDMNDMLMHLNNEVKELNVKLEYADKFEKALGHMIKISESEGAQAGLLLEFYLKKICSEIDHPPSQTQLHADAAAVEPAPNVTDHEKEKSTLCNLIVESQGTIRSHEKELSKSRSLVIKQALIIEEQDSTIKQHTLEYERLLNMLSDEESKHKMQAAEIERLTKTLSALEGEHTRLQANYDSKAEALETTRKSIDTFNTENRKLIGEIKKLEKDLEAAAKSEAEGRTKSNGKKSKVAAMKEGGKEGGASKEGNKRGREEQDDGALLPGHKRVKAESVLAED